MTIRTKLLLAYFSISTLIIIVGLIFYVQLKNLIQPLTPQSIPQGVEQLSDTIDNNDYAYRLLYQELLVRDNLINYVLTKNPEKLQEYYMNQEMLSLLVKKTEIKIPVLWDAIEDKYKEIEKMQFKIIQLMQQGNTAAANAELTGNQYSSATQEVGSILNQYFQKNDLPSNEDAVVKVKLAIKEITKILHGSLNTTLLIFIIAIIISILLALISSRAISHPVNLLRNNIERMSLKNLGIPINPKLLKLKGEIGDLARSFNTLISKLRTTTVLRDKLLEEIERRKKTESDLRLTTLNLQESNRELDQFAYAASHDLRAPLRAISNLAEWIEEDCSTLLPEESKKHLELLKKRVNRLDSLINGILEYSRAGRTTTHLETINLNLLLAEIIENLAPPEHIKILVNDSMPTIKTNKVAITQVFLNLINNAIKYNDKPNGLIQIGYKIIDHYYEFHVADNGPGIDPQYHEKIFIIFQTLQSRDAIESSGIGLAIVKKIIEKYTGKIWLTSQVDEGTTFYFTWPRPNE